MQYLGYYPEVTATDLIELNKTLNTCKTNKLKYTISNGGLYLTRKIEDPMLALWDYANFNKQNRLYGTSAESAGR